MHGALRSFFFVSPIVWNMCENLHFFNEAVYFKVLHITKTKNNIDRQHTERGQL